MHEMTMNLERDPQRVADLARQKEEIGFLRAGVATL